jgi:GNAT superfamily N-acetyltransferase
VRVEFVDPIAWERAGELRALLFAELYRDFGVSEASDWMQAATGDTVAVALDAGGEVLGAARLLGAPGEAERQVRQVAVAGSAQGRGVGAALMAAVERRAADEGASAVWLHARDTAIAFYEARGYECVSETFVSELTGIPHKTMRKGLG